MTVESAKMIAILALIALLALGYVVTKFVKAVTTKAILLLVVGGLILGVWTQRGNLSDCAGRIKDRVAAGDRSKTTCSFFGWDAKVDLPGN